ncbi:hypothetical protein ACF0H5_002077 [Mactra antiquata]
MNRDRDLDYIDDESDQEGAESSSDDEIDILLHGTPEQKRKLCRRASLANESSSEDDFEKEMNAELNGKVKELERRRGSISEAGSSGVVTENEPQRFHDDVYFDSDEEDMVNQGDAKKKQKKLSNDDLLYDPDMDDDNEKWVENQRRSYMPKSDKPSNKPKKLPNSDAVLNCPACMTTLCLDCQRHDVYNNQYRAMFVSNCKVDTSEFLKYPKAGKNSRKRRKSEKSVEDDKFNPVKCEECNTVVAVYDEDEVYHFFNVLASY